MFLSDLIVFESEVDTRPQPQVPPGQTRAPGSGSGSGPATATVQQQDSTARAQEIINRATRVLEAARQALGSDGAVQTPAPGTRPPGPGRTTTTVSAATSTSTTPSTAASSAGGGPSGAAPAPAAAPGAGGSAAAPAAPGAAPPASGTSQAPLLRRWSSLSDEQDQTRHVLQSALDRRAANSQGGQPRAAGAAPSTARGGGGGAAGGSSAGTGARGSRAAGAAASRAGGAAVLPASGAASGGAAGGGEGGSGSGAPPPSWAQSFLGSSESFMDGPGSTGLAAMLQPAPGRQAAPSMGALVFAEPNVLPYGLDLPSQATADAERARRTELPPLQSVMELTTAFRPPERTGSVAAPTPDAVSATATAGRALADGSGVLADGTRWEKKSGIEYGENGFWKRWQLLRGSSGDGSVEFEETWWEASDWTGMREMGAEKKGNDAAGGAWNESWTERLMYTNNASLDCVVERTAHKWAHDEQGDEWEERWGEYYHAAGKVSKWADKWGMQGPNVWHERWGEDYEGGGGDACVKWTDKWAERLLPGGAREQWGDKWREQFASGRGEKNGEVWSVTPDGHRYQRWWGEQHHGDGRVRRHGHSTGGEQWDDTIQMDTYYNPVPHFGFRLALQHSPQLKGVPLRPKPVDESSPLGPGLDAL